MTADSTILLLLKMLSLLTFRETGVDKSHCFSQAERTRRVYTLDLSKYRDVEQVNSSVNGLDIDSVDHR